MENLSPVKITDDLFVEVIQHPEHIFLLPGKEVAKGYGVTSENIRKHKSENSDEFAENKHWVVRNTHTLGGEQDTVFWTLRGIMRLGFMIKSENARKFRDWAEDTLFDHATGKITTRASILREKISKEQQKADIIERLKQNEDYKALVNIETEIKNAGKNLRLLDNSVIDMQSQLFENKQ